MQAVSPPPDGCYPDFTTAEGCNALNFLTTGAGNTGLGWRSLFFDTTGSFNTGVGGGALALNNGGFQYGTGSRQRFCSTPAAQRTPLLERTRWFTTTPAATIRLLARSRCLTALAIYNTALGAGAGTDPGILSNNIYIGDAGFVGDNNVISIGGIPASGTHYEKTYIGGIYDAVVQDRPVYIQSDGHLGTLASSRRYKEGIKPMDKASEALFGLKPVTFRYKQQIDPSHKLSFGLIAEEVAKYQPRPD